MKKREGQITVVVSMYFLIFLIVIIGVMLQLHIYRSVGSFTEDALAASSLASAVIDIQEYGTTKNIIIAEPDQAYSCFQRVLKTNMELDEQWNSANTQAISGPVEVINYIVYNVREDDVEIYYFGQSTYSQTVTGGLGTVTAPNGKTIESTSIYSSITFPVNGIFGIQTIAKKEVLVDIVSN